MCTKDCQDRLEAGVQGAPLPLGDSPSWWSPAPDLRRDELRVTYEGKEYVGYLVAPPASAGSRPLVLVVHNFQGLKFFDVHQAEYLARVGYVGLAIDMYDKDVHPPENRLQPEDQAKTMDWIKACFEQMVAVDHDAPKMRGIMKVWLDAGLAHETVDANFAPAAIGYCFGGAVVIDVVRGGLNLGGIVSFHGLLQGGIDPNPLKYCKIERPPLKPCNNNYNKDTIMLIENGTTDELVPQESIDSFIAEFSEAGCDWRFVNQGLGCGHGFTLPPSLGIPSHLHDKGDRRATTDMLNLFLEIFPGVPQNPVEKNAAGTIILHAKAA
mmetsp:Transcript_9226/g.29288  ORF Transcript_9226/g.29288 Transcript_9226/m.29288 type:complete len:324 (-) Transcript_9226:137-1108(-)